MQSKFTIELELYNENMLRLKKIIFVFHITSIFNIVTDFFITKLVLDGSVDLAMKARLRRALGSLAR